MRNMKTTTHRQFIIKLLKTNDKRKSFKATRENKAHYKQKDKDKNYSQFPIRNNAGERIVEQDHDSCERKPLNLEFCTQKKYLLKIKVR